MNEEQAEARKTGRLYYSCGCWRCPECDLGLIDGMTKCPRCGFKFKPAKVYIGPFLQFMITEGRREKPDTSLWPYSFKKDAKKKADTEGISFTKALYEDEK